MEGERSPDEKWDEVITSIRGSCRWCAAVVRAIHFCELTVLHGVEAPVLCGVGEDSAYEELPAFLEKPGTVLIQRELLAERQNPGSHFEAKVGGVACVLAHEMAHHAFRHEWNARRHDWQITGISVEQRRQMLEELEASKLVAIMGLPYEVIVDHWAIADDAMLAKLLDYAAERSDEHAIRADEDSVIEHGNLPAEAGIHVAEEWSAAVVGCMMRFRFEKGREFATQRATSIMNNFLRGAEATLVRTVLMASCQNPNAEQGAIERAITSLETAFHNSDIQACEQSLRKNGSNWAALLSA